MVRRTQDVHEVEIEDAALAPSVDASVRLDLDVRDVGVRVFFSCWMLPEEEIVVAALHSRRAPSKPS